MTGLRKWRKGLVSFGILAMTFSLGAVASDLANVVDIRPEMQPTQFAKAPFLSGERARWRHPSSDAKDADLEDDKSTYEAPKIDEEALDRAFPTKESIDDDSDGEMNREYEIIED